MTAVSMRAFSCPSHGRPMPGWHSDSEPHNDPKEAS